MGGYGSGERWRSKPKTDAALRLDIRWLARVGLIRPGLSGWMPMYWTCNGKPSGDIRVRYDGQRPDELILDYRTRGPYETDWTDIRDVVALERTPCHYGGERIWCRCPGCGSRRAVLYSVHGRFRCVPCNRLAYSSTREEPLDRRGEKITDRLGAEREWVLNWLVPPFKPEGMHWRTYERLRREWQAVDAAANDVYTSELFRMVERTERVLAERRTGK